MSDYNDLFEDPPESNGGDPNVVADDLSGRDGLMELRNLQAGVTDYANHVFDENTFASLNDSPLETLPELAPDDRFIKELEFVTQLSRPSAAQQNSAENQSLEADAEQQPELANNGSRQQLKVPEINVEDIDQLLGGEGLGTIDAFDVDNSLDFSDFEGDFPYPEQPSQTITTTSLYPLNFRPDPSFFLINPRQEPPKLSIPAPHNYSDDDSGLSDYYPDSRAISPVEELTDASEIVHKKSYGRERPKSDPNKPWIRVSSKSRENARAAQSNQYDSLLHYGYPRNSLKLWLGTRYTFDYDNWGGLQKACYRRDQLREFLLDHPIAPDSHLTLWIQLQPSDSAKRYPSSHSSQCRFAECPDRQIGSSRKRLSRGVIWQGRVKVAFDERWYSQKIDGDPFLCAGFVHLYCMEQFLDFPEICRHLDVKADGREFLPKEPGGRFAAALPENVRIKAANFIQSCKDGTLVGIYPDYPKHGEYEAGTRKPHVKTLTYALVNAKVNSQSRSMYRTKKSRGLEGSNELVHLGDEDKYLWARMERKQATSRSRYERRKRKQKDAGSDEERETLKRSRRRTSCDSPRGRPRYRTDEQPQFQKPNKLSRAVDHPQVPNPSQGFYSVDQQQVPDPYHGSLSDTEIATALTSLNDSLGSNDAVPPPDLVNFGYFSDTGPLSPSMKKPKLNPKSTSRKTLADPHPAEEAREALMSLPEEFRRGW
ncbi:hypothetical protein P152DRAFT_159901 [Eremomyces bilateralis CBS 781.70]|uniref:Uncharacterized protein n=1 Tax=Eremomyces bilateralis CBS 781.70 TaxID=1392243 RepID=A0A6G1FUV3_9PEZI|nr:uncharacterized protein P152DRAFT_159901 [Eremomyces bilateralis CBS 781.70]KAF1809540.1 hypothetical protein P152DRAFT_159901 [Eremomyces bilateralis CBS 781.70]